MYRQLAHTQSLISCQGGKNNGQVTTHPTFEIGVISLLAI